MFKLDENLLQELGLGALPPAEKNKMLQHIYETLEMRVGMKLAEQMTNEQLDEFESFMTGSMEVASAYLDKVYPTWREDKTYQANLAKAQASGTNEAAVASEFAALKWLETNFPGYKDVVASELDALKNEVKSNATAIVEASAQQQ